MQRLLALLEKELGFDVQPATPLLSTGLVDSLRFAELVTEIERAYGVAIDPSEVGMDNFDTPIQMLAFVSPAS